MSDVHSAHGIEVSGGAILSVIAGMGAFEATARRFLREVGIDPLDAGAWYSAEGWIRSLDAIAQKVGARTLFYVGNKVPETAMLPPTIVDVASSLRAIDVGYHMNHRRDGALMFDPTTGVMMEGIGHYALREVDDDHGILVCDDPYPCELDTGIVHGFAVRFAPDPALVRVAHATAECRKKGDRRCEYRVTWV